ncbi:hypothetical protein ACFSSC_05610 [Corynebacterium mendelii]|uniref:Secreted protein n=1 Tax=Corynebacterium mendelii TaxID=2765362 RepID=A0A939E066_9CORY|nr:hypothetical protein [Corynebacterium mendelii]MBN9643122.1 hypothetical protein [Corynebacterium mendelii]
MTRRQHVERRFIRPRLVAATAAVAVTAGLAACGSGSPSDGSGESAATAATVAASPPKTTVLDPGSAPSTLLAFSPTAQEQNLLVEVTAGFSQNVLPAGSAGTAPQAPQSTDTMWLTLDGGQVPVDGEDAAGIAAGSSGDGLPAPDRRTDFTVTGIDYTDGTGTDPVSAVGFGFGSDTDATGRVYRWRLSAPDNATTGARALVEAKLLALAGIPVIFPDQPIGRGAVWTTSAPLPGDTSMLQEVTYTLIDIDQPDGTDHPVVTLALEIDRHPALRDIPYDSGARAAALSVLSATTTTRGQLRVDLSRPLPATGEISLTTRVIYGASTTGETDRDTGAAAGEDPKAPGRPAAADTWVVQDTTFTIGFNPPDAPGH